MSDSESQRTSLDYSKEVKNKIERKAKSNKRWSTFFFIVILFSGVFSPILILISEDVILSKYLPACLTAFSAICASWIQLRKPHDRWVLYRTAQREVEFELDQHEFGNGFYSDKLEKDKILADRVSKRALQLHYEWMPIVPKIEDINKLSKTEAK